MLSVGLLLGLALPGCGDAAGDTIYSAPDDSSTEGAGPSIVLPQYDTPVGGLCTACSDTGDCGGEGDFCIVNESSGERFCARECADSADCPVGYDCAYVQNSSVRQCAPRTRGCGHIAYKEIAPAIEVQRAYAVDAMNDARASAGLSPLVEEACLSRLAQASCEELARTGVPRGLFARECDVAGACVCGWESEQEVSIAGLGLEWRDAIDEPISQLVVAAPGGDFQTAALAARFSRIGVGLVLSGDEAWACFAYAE